MSKPIPGMLTGDQALERLIEGNKRYAMSRQKHPHQGPTRRAELCGGQNPFAVILGCADSRIPPELIFDQGLGDLFVVRVAGNIIDDVVLGSIEYAALHLCTPLIIVLGHSQCGAISATVQGEEFEGHLSSLATAIQPVLNTIQASPGERVDQTAKANAKMISEKIRQSTPVLSRLVGEAGLKVIAAFYDLDTGLVEILI
ncbi:MAG: carbonic anhydrase [Desulfatiglans sp.]|nr:carbonic anhydrase [Thermodesulfobacteriota bacterium]MEE4353107.1 carbonic anhydrase [Desulfatiglans sp.]